jgi:hypothetical protein
MMMIIMIMMMIMVVVVVVKVTMIVIKFSSLFIYVVTQQPRGQLRSEHDQTDKQNTYSQKT